MFSEAEKQEIRCLYKEIKRLDNEILCSDMADGKQWFIEEPMRKEWRKERSECYNKIHSIAGDRDWVKAICGGE